MLTGAEITVLAEFSDQPGPLRGRVLGKASPILVGLSLLIDCEQDTGEPFRLLVDTSSHWSLLRDNAAALGIDLCTLDAVFISHWHYDHSAALPALLRHVGRPLPVYAPPLTQPFDPLKAAIALRLPRSADLRICREPHAIVSGLRTTGAHEVVFPRPPLVVHEHALSITVGERPPAVVVGCSHAPLEWLVEGAAGDEPISWLLGGLHFVAPTTEPRKVELVEFLRRRKPAALTPMHCTGQEGIERIARELPELVQPLALGERRAV